MFPIQDHDLDSPERVSVSCTKLDRGDAEALARLGELEAIPVEKNDHFTVPGACPKGAVLLLLDDNRAAREFGRERHVATLERVAVAAEQLDDIIDAWLHSPLGRAA